MNTSSIGIALARKGANASLLVLPAAMGLAAPAAAQSVISTSHYAPVNLARYGNAGVSIANGVTVDSQSWAALWDLSPAQLSNAGQVQAANGAGIWLGGGGGVTNTGSVAGNNAVELWASGSVANSGNISATRYGVVVNGGAGQVSNSGAISAGFDGVSLNQGGGVTNTGSIFGGHIGVYTGNGAGSVTNSGQISASRGDAVSLYSGGSLTNTETGRLLGGYSGVYAGGDGSRITNAGLISGPDFGVYLTGASSLNNSGTIAGGIGGAIDTGGGGVVENTGLITGTTAGVKLAKGGTLDNAGTIAGATGIIASGAVDIIDTGSIIATGGGNAISLSRGASSITLGTGAQIVGDIAGNGTASSISLTGGGTLSSDIMGFGSGGSLIVAQGASWAGTGTWNVAQMVNNGSFSAGLATAPLRLNGNFSQSDTGTLVVLVKPGQVSSFSVTGTIKLGGTLTYVLAPGTYTPASYQFLEADAGLSGSFAQVEQVAQPLTLSLNSQAARLLVNSNFTVAPQGAGLLPDLSQAMTLDAQTMDDLLLGHAMSPGAGAECRNAPAQGDGKAGIASAIASGFCAAGGWVEAAGSNLATDGFNMTGGGFLAGVDHAIPATDGRIGLAAGYDDAAMRGKGTGTADLETVRLGLYANQPMGAFVLSGAVLDGIVNASTARQTGADAAVARENGNVLSLAAQAALPLAWGGWDISPAAGLRVTRVAIGGLAEGASVQAFALNGGASSGATVTPFLHLNLGRGYVAASHIVITPRVTFGVEGSLGNPGVGLGLATQDGTAFTLNPQELSPVSGVVGLGLRMAKGDWALDIGYSGRFAGNWSAQSLQAAVSARF
ncbi:autotransporter outer membrane beta-barrel domain-containing protein [Acidocella aromatica]|uniref:Autotransporter domain-containing protein n=1 Tax=Acidocella aromatica TaxID=1303579 RepID=A0A840VRX9_9PROT|nr:hypothetical protein [Acidocella aromatica]MBB5374351.1 hypothetical protein [Acidocella aromatica]